MNKKIIFTELDWDSGYFDVKSGRIDLYKEIDESEKRLAIQFMNEFDFVSIHNHSNNSKNNIWIGKETTAFLTDMNIQFLKKPQKNNWLDPNTVITNKLKYDSEIVESSKKSFTYSRFFNDTNFPCEKSKKIYTKWIESSFDKDNKYFIVTKDNNGNFQGVVLFSISNEKTAVIELIFILEKYRNEGIGSRLLMSLENFTIQNNIDIINVGTQIDNITAIQFYNKHNFKYKNCTSIYHIWKDNN